MSGKKNIIASVKDRLRSIAKKEEKNHQLLLLRYFQERFLFRLSQSQYRRHFCLKGAALLYALEGERSRGTKDIDFLGMYIESTHETLQRAITEICAIKYLADGVTFDYESFSVADILKEERYKGIRIGINAHLGRTKQKLQIDVGFGDVVIPQPVEMTYPVILEMEAPVLLAYSIQSIIAEKFEAMIDLAEVNTRMKDFYDVYHLLKNHPIDFGTLEQAIQQTFQRRGTPSQRNHSLFQPTFFLDKERNDLWKAWLRKARLDSGIEFSEVMTMISDQLEPIFQRLT